MCADLYRAATLSSLPSESTVNFLSEILFELPDFGDALLKAIGRVELRVKTHLVCAHHALDELPMDGSTSRVRHDYSVAAGHACRLLALLDFSTAEMSSENVAEFDRLLQRIVSVVTSGLMDRAAVFSCFLAHKSPSSCRRFFELLDAADRTRLISSAAAVHVDSADLAMPTDSLAGEQTSSIVNTSGIATVYAADLTVSTSSFTSSVYANSVCNSKVDDSEDRLSVPVPKVGSDLSSNISDNVSFVFALSSTSDYRTAWYHLFLECFNRKIHFFDLFLVRHAFCAILQIVFLSFFIGFIPVIL